MMLILMWLQEPSEFQEQAALFAQHCVKCHTIGEGDRVGPDLKGVTDRRPREWLVGFVGAPSRYLDTDPVAKELLEKYGGVRMTDLGLAPAQVEGLVDYIEAASAGRAGGPPPVIRLVERDLGRETPGPDEGGGVSWGGAAVTLLLLAGAAGLWRLGLWRLSQIGIVLALGAATWSLGGRDHYRWVGNDQGYAPPQPIPFSHDLHAGQMNIGCLYCHPAAEKGPVAGVPGVGVCMNCHRVVKKRAEQTAPSAEIAKIHAAWEAGTTIEWVRVHRLPDYVFFNHSAHVTNGVECQTCHGPVQTMERVRQAGDLSMGWCIDCHRHRDEPPPTHWQRAEGTLDCTACHQ